MSLADRLRRPPAAPAVLAGPVVGRTAEWRDVPLDVIRVGAGALTALVEPGAVRRGEQLRLLTADRGLSVAFEVIDVRATGGRTVVELKERGRLELPDRRQPRTPGEGRPAVISGIGPHAAPISVPVRLVDESAAGVRFAAPARFAPGDALVLSEDGGRRGLEVVHRLARPFGRVEYGCRLVELPAAITPAGARPPRHLRLVRR